jgi:hypothetical protein
MYCGYCGRFGKVQIKGVYYKDSINAKTVFMKKFLVSGVRCQDFHPPGRTAQLEVTIRLTKKDMDVQELKLLLP